VHPEDEQLLARWEADDRADEIWQTIQAHAIGPFPLPDNKWSEPLDLFIPLILMARKAVTNIDDVYRRWEKRRIRYHQLAISAERLARFYDKALIGASLKPEQTKGCDYEPRYTGKMYKLCGGLLRGGQKCFCVLAEWIETDRVSVWHSCI
jgi:hypothetical protein